MKISEDSIKPSEDKLIAADGHDMTMILLSGPYSKDNKDELRYLANAIETLGDLEHEVKPIENGTKLELWRTKEGYRL